jgi:hypothetical protein
MSIDVHILVAIRMVDSSSIIHTMPINQGMEFSKLRDVDPPLLKKVFCVMFDYMSSKQRLLAKMLMQLWWHQSIVEKCN